MRPFPRTMPKRGRPRKGHSLFVVKNYIEYTSDSESDIYNVQHNVSYEINQQQHQQEGDGQGEVPILVQQHQHQQDQHEGHQHQYQQEEHQHQQDQHEGHQHQQEGQHHQQEGQQDQQEDHHHQQEGQQEDQVPILVPQHNEDIIENMLGQVQIIFDEQQDEEDVQIDSPSESDPETNDTEEDYDAILKDFKSKWLLAEIDHSVSKSASECFWKLALNYFSKLSCAPRKKIPLFKTIRSKMYKELVPKIDLQIGYKNKVTGQITSVNDTITPVKNYPPDKFEKIYEIGTIKVKLNNRIKIKITVQPLLQPAYKSLL